jgi:hypothetical protein
MGYRFIGEDIVGIDGVIRHDNVKLAKIIFGFIEEI